MQSKSKNTKPELAIRKILYSKGYRYKIHHKKLPGKPDIVLTKLKTIINVHGCYWHYHGCEKSCIPKTRSEYWLTRLEANKSRDFFNKQKLIKLGWKVIDLWECTLNKNNIFKTFARLERQIAL
jgi:DNA mismatch endonuclease, patch repair protein